MTKLKLRFMIIVLRYLSCILHKDGPGTHTALLEDKDELMADLVERLEQED